MNTSFITVPSLESIREVIRNRPRRMELTHIAEKTDVSVDWLNKLIAGDIPNPGYNRIKAVVDYVTTG